MGDKYQQAIDDAGFELMRALKQYPEMRSHHEGYAILLEEVDEAWDIVKLKAEKRNKNELRKEMIQIAAMAMRFAAELC